MKQYPVIAPPFVLTWCNCLLGCGQGSGGADCSGFAAIESEFGNLLSHRSIALLVAGT